MKYFLILSTFLLMLSCSTGKKTVDNTSANPYPTPPENLTPQYRGGGIGPVNITASNFFFKGELRQTDGKLTLFDCFTATTIPIDNKSGIYSELFSKFQSMYAAPVFVAMRGFISQMQGSKNQLVASYLINMHEATCNSDEIITGNWISNSMGTSPDGIIVMINNDFTFILNVNLPEKKLSIKGTWAMLSDSSIFFSYQQVTQYFSHTGTFDAAKSTIIVPTDKGAISLKKL